MTILSFRHDMQQFAGSELKQMLYFQAIQAMGPPEPDSVVVKYLLAT